MSAELKNLKFVKKKKLNKLSHKLFIIQYPLHVCSITWANSAIVLEVVWCCFYTTLIKHWETITHFSPSDMIQLMTLKYFWQVWHCWKYQCDRWSG